MGTALRFLTVLPVPGPHRAPGPGTLLAFPVVGGLVGLVWVAVASTDLVFAGPLVAAALVLVADAVLTGVLHLDGLADVADAVASRRRGAEAIAVMRDSAVGAGGALALVLATLVRFTALLALLGVPRIGQLLVLVAAPVTGRVAMVMLLALAGPAREGSLAAAMPRPSRAVIVGVAGAGAALSGLPGPAGLVALLVGFALTVAYAAWWRARFGDLTGDGIGACGVLAETAALLTLVAA